MKSVEWLTIKYKLNKMTTSTFDCHGEFINLVNAFARRVHENAVEKGFHPDYEDINTWFANQVNNLHCEVSELWEAYRNGTLSAPCDKHEKMTSMGLEPLTCEEEEYADVIIRVLDQCRRKNVNIGKAIVIKHLFNLTRPHKHGKIN